jgi:alkylation response protein AidB-like acyl-CoA dehydrogenase
VPDGDGYRVSGRIAWAANIAPGTVIVFPARVVAPPTVDATRSGAQPGGDAPEVDANARVILCTTVGEPGLITAPVNDLLALGATRSAMLEFDNLRVDPSRVVATSLDACRTRRSTHLTLQSAFCLGIAGRCLTEAAGFLAGPGGILAAHHARLVAQHAHLTATLHRVSDDLHQATPQEITLLRYESARLAHAAARHESTLVGGRGYVTTSATNRRLREASFLPVQSPSEIQLLQELEQLGVFPAETYSI